MNYKVSVAPMMDCTDKHDRYFLRLISKNVMLYTEMIVSNAIIKGNKDKILKFNSLEKPLALQIGGSNPKELAEATKIGKELGKISQHSFSIHCPSGPISLLGSAHVTAALNSKLPMEHAVYEINDRSNYIYPKELIITGEFVFPTGHV